MIKHLLNGILDRIEDFGYALAGLPPVNRKDSMYSTNADPADHPDWHDEEWRDAVDHDDPDYDHYPEDDYDEYDLDLDGYYEGYYGDEDER